MATDVYLQLDGIKGESADSEHAGWIEITSIHLGVLQPKSATSSTAGGHTAERCEHRTITVSKLADMASPILMQTSSSGKTLAKGKIEFMRADSDGKRVKYYEVELENVLIGHVDQQLAPGDILHETVGLKFSKIKWKYTQQKIGGGAGGNTAGGWDLAANKIAA
jgi:type VI secretion system secreted protein Hcp